MKFYYTFNSRLKKLSKKWYFWVIILFVWPILLFIWAILWSLNSIYTRDKKVSPFKTAGFWTLLLIIFLTLIGLTQKPTNNTATSHKSNYNQNKSHKISAKSSQKNNINSAKESKTTQKKAPTSQKSNNNSKIQSDFNSDVLQSLSEDQGFASGTLDENGNPLPEGQTREPNEQFAWSLGISKIEYYDAGTNGVKIYISSNATQNLTKNELLNVIKHAQKLASASIYTIGSKAEKYFDVNSDNNFVPYIVVVDESGREIGRSSAWDHSFEMKNIK